MIECVGEMVAIGNRLTQDAKWTACFGIMRHPEIGVQVRQRMEELAQGRILPQDAIQNLQRFLATGQVQMNGKSLHISVPLTFVNCLWHLCQ